MPGWLRRYGPVLVMLVLLTLLMYPLALVFGLPLARRNMEDLRRWQRRVILAEPVADLTGLAEGAAGTLELSFYDLPEAGVLVRGETPLPLELTLHPDQNRVSVGAGEALFPLVSWRDSATPLSEGLYQFSEPMPEDAATVYVGERLARAGAVSASWPPDGQRRDFIFPGAHGPVLVNDQLLREGEDYTVQGDDVLFSEPPPFGSDVRRVNGDYAVLEPSAGTLVFAEPPGAEVRLAEAAVRLAEVLEGEVDGSNQTFFLSGGQVVESDRNRAVFVDGRQLSDTAERAPERVDGEATRFTFESLRGIITVDGEAVREGEDYQREGNLIRFFSPPARNAALRQYPDYFLADFSSGELELAEPPEPGAVVWARRYTVYAQPGCGTTVFECFYALPQHPVPFPHWIAQRTLPFFQRYPLTDPRNALRATLYTVSGTLAALGLGGAVGIVLAVLFVLLRPLERALLPWVIASQTIPIIALVPVLLLVLGNFGITIQTSLLPTALIGAYIAFFPVVVGTVKGLRSVSPLALDLMRSYAATPLQVFLKLRFPAAAPFLFTSLKLGTAAALVGALVAETESNNRRGLGFQILGQVQAGNVADVWILLLVSALLGIGLVALVGLIERLVAPWEHT